MVRANKQPLRRGGLRRGRGLLMKGRLFGRIGRMKGRIAADMAAHALKIRRGGALPYSAASRWPSSRGAEWG